jgi:fucose permease
MLTLLNAVYGVGAILGPAGVGLLAAGGFRLPFLLVTGAALALLPLGLALSGDAPASAPAEYPTPAVSVFLRPLVVFMVAFFLYGGLEAGIGAWEPTHLVATGLSVAGAATITSLFWTSFTLGRLVAAPLALLVKPEHLVLGCLAITVALTLSTRVDAMTAAAYTGCGLFLGPIFPLAVVWSGRVTRTTQRVTSLVISGDLLGGTVLPPLLGQLVTSVGVGTLPMAFAALAAGSFCTLLTIQLLGRRPIAMSAA